MSLTVRFNTALFCILVLACATFTGKAIAQETARKDPGLAGSWIINSELSDNTDKKVEAALKAMGQKIDRCWFNCEEDRYRGGPEEQELYDRISYDKTLSITLDEPEYIFTYDDNYRREVYTDGRSQSVSLTGLDQVNDFSMGHWENTRLLVEARPRDEGFANEIYSLVNVNDTTRLRAELYIQPGSFTEPVEIVRFYDRITDNSGQQ